VVDENEEEEMETLFPVDAPPKKKKRARPVKGAMSARSGGRKSASAQVDPADVDRLFWFWRDTLGKKALLSDERRAILAWAILNYGMDACEMAVKGCSMSDWHMGRNPSNVRYDSVELIFRDSEKVEWFVSKFHAGSPGHEAF